MAKATKKSGKKSNNAKSVKKSVKTAPKKAVKKAPKNAPKNAAAKPVKAVAQKSAKQKAGKPQAGKKVAKKAVAPAPKKAAAKSSNVVVKKAAVKTAAILDYTQYFTPLDDRVLVLKQGFSNRTAGGLYIPDTVSGEDRPTQGTVVAVGSGHRDKKGRLRPLDVKVGDTVMFNAYTGSEVKIEASDLLCLRESEIIAIVKS